jgi:phospholipid/cholesterol/gamma-HCH transport system permease protein
VILYIDKIGRWLISYIQYILQVLLMIYLSIRATFFGQTQGMTSIISVLATQIYFTGCQAMPLISVMALATGSITILQSSSELSLLNGSELIGNLLVVIIVREIGPLLTALIVVARSGTAVAIEVGKMRANREIEVLESLGINPLSFIVFPRIFGGVISLVGLCFYFVVIALIGGFLLTRIINEMPLDFFLDSLVYALTLEDFFLFLIKTIFSGMIIFSVSCYEGLAVKRSHHEVPQVVTKSVVDCIFFVTLFNLLISILFYFHQLNLIGEG